MPAGAKLLRPADAVERRLHRSERLPRGRTSASWRPTQPGHPHRRRRDELPAGTEARLPGAAGRAHPGAKPVAAHVYDINEFLWLQYEAGKLQTDFRPQPALPAVPHVVPPEAAPHRPARPRAAGADSRPDGRRDGRRLLRHRRHLRLQARKDTIAQAVGQPLFDKIAASGAPQAVCDNETCRWNLAANTGLDVVHTVEVLAEAYGVEREV